MSVFMNTCHSSGRNTNGKLVNIVRWTLLTELTTRRFYKRGQRRTFKRKFIENHSRCLRVG